ncbi:MAG: tetratricopeptide repeat protein [Deltaproteobacteria bacterium]|nr:tetratricopeptide repeat protein [Deltaproteobacteria bacterium]
MLKKGLLTALFSLTLIMSLTATVYAQDDMVFESEDGTTAEPAAPSVVAPPPKPAGPPSEALANALRFYQQERYAQASVQLQRIVAGETGDEPANVQKAQFFLGKCFYHLGFFQAALGVFEEIALMSTGHIYFHSTLQWLAQLSRELPEPAGIISLVGRYGDSLQVLSEFKRPETKDLYNELLYLMGRYWYQMGEFSKAREFFMNIDKASPLKVSAEFFSGITYVRQRKAKPASKAFLKIVERYDGKLFLDDEETRFLNLAWLSLARIYYSTKHWDSAVMAWNKIPQSSEYYLDAQFEESWAYFQIDNYSRALGNIHTLNSPYFEESFYPESVILKAVIFFDECLYDDAKLVVNEFRNDFEPLKDKLSGALSKFKDNQQFFDFLKSLRKAIDDGELKDISKTEIMGLQRDVAFIIKGALGDRTLLRNLEYVSILEKENDKLKQMPAQFVNSAAGQRITQDIETAKSVAIDNTGNLARSRYERLLQEIQDFLNQTTRVEIEILKALRGELEVEIATGENSKKLDAEQAKISSDGEHVIWPFQGEYWRDELGYYRQPVTRHCGR